MVAVALIVTGRLEQYALADSLKQVFPEVDFSVQMVDGFTSAKVALPPPTAIHGVKSAIEKYATAFVASVHPGRRKRRPDFVFGIEDLEIANRDQPEAVIQAFRSALLAELENRRRNENAATYEKLVKDILEKCSFHLFSLMPEAYFFADRTALRIVGCNRPAVLPPDLDVERFITADPDYLEVPQQPSLVWTIDPLIRPHHPKRYLQFLLHPAAYSETDHGARALRQLDWRTVLANPRRTLFLRSMFQDLAFAVGCEQSEFPGDANSLTSDYRKEDRVVRNF